VRSYRLAEPTDKKIYNFHLRKVQHHPGRANVLAEARCRFYRKRLLR
jgi:hypothetical protein